MGDDCLKSPGIDMRFLEMATLDSHTFCFDHKRMSLARLRGLSSQSFPARRTMQLSSNVAETIFANSEACKHCPLLTVLDCIQPASIEAQVSTTAPMSFSSS